MALTPFYASAEGDPVRMQRKIGWQTALGVPAPAGNLIDFMSNGGPVAPSPTQIERAVIRNTTMRQAPIQSKSDVVGGPLDMGDLDVGNGAHLRAILSALGRYATTNPSGAHYRHRISQAGASAPTVNALTLYTDDDTGNPVRWVDVRASGFSLVCQNRANLRLTVPIAPGKFDMHGAVTQTSGTGSTLPELRHTWSGNTEETDDTDIYVQVVTASPLTIKVKVGSATTYDGAAISVTPGTWQYLTYLTGNAPLGRRDEQIQIYWPTSPTLVDADAFRILNRRARWSPSYGTARVLAEIQARFYLGTDEIVLDGGWTLTVAIPGVETRYAPGTSQPIGTFRSGFQDVSLQISRRMIDYTLQRALLERQTLSCVLEMKNDTLIGATSAYYGAAIVLPAVTLTGPAHSTDAGGTNRDETFTLMCKEAASAFVYNGLNFTADCEVVVDTDLATIV